MLIAIISDVHNNTVNLKKVLDYCRKNKIKKIICCGDLASEETLNFLNDSFSGKIFYTFGNMDTDQLTSIACHPELDSGSKNNKEGFRIKSGMTCNYKNTKIFKDLGEAKIEGIKTAFVHYPVIAKELCQTGKYDFVFYGHTHKPWTESVKIPSSAKASARQCTLLNPGNVAGEIYPPTFAVWDTKDSDFELIKIHDLK